MDCYAKLPQARADIMYNQLSSHDISRHNSLLGRDYKKISAALVFQFTLPGVPSIFYGDETGLTGVGDPACRAAMVWDEKRRATALFEAYKKLVAARKKYDALAYGGFRIIRAENGVICYIRKHMKETALCVVNTSPNDAGLRFEPAELFMTGAVGRVELIFDSTEFEGLSAEKKGAKKFTANEIKAAGGALETRVRQSSSLAVYIREAR
jgi:glycosidase